MKINNKILSIPPYISTSWKNVVSLHKKNETLIIGLVNGAKIEIPDLDPTIMDAVFAAHEKYLEQETTNPIPKNGNMIPTNIPGEASTIISFPFRIGLDANMGNLLQHNSEAANSPDLPKEILEKIAALANMVESENINNFPKAEPHCNCMHCQIMRVIHNGKDQNSKDLAEEEFVEISPEDLRFREWDVEQAGDKLYLVSNPFNNEEHYNVFLGQPIGCTCGQHNCEHIRAVLNT